MRYKNVKIVETHDDGTMIIYGEAAPIPPPFDKVIWPIDGSVNMGLGGKIKNCGGLVYIN